MEFKGINIFSFFSLIEFNHAWYPVCQLGLFRSEALRIRLLIHGLGSTFFQSFALPSWIFSAMLTDPMIPVSRSSQPPLSVLASYHSFQPIFSFTPYLTSLPPRIFYGGDFSCPPLFSHISQKGLKPAPTLKLQCQPIGIVHHPAVTPRPPTGPSG